jgi:hypothetical protein
VGYSQELNALIRSLIDEEVPYYYRKNDREYNQYELAAAVRLRLRDEHPEYENEFIERSAEDSMVRKVKDRLGSPKTQLATSTLTGDKDGPYQTRLNLNIPIPGQKSGAMTPVYECTLREVMLEVNKRTKYIDENRMVLKDLQDIVSSMLERGAELDDYVKDFFEEAA